MRSMFQSLSALAVAITFAAVPGEVAAQAPPAAEGERLTIGTKTAPPFSFQEDDRWTGASIDLWHALARELDLQYDLRDYGDDLDALLAAVRNGEVDAGVAAITVNGDRERVMDFSHPFYSTGYGIAVRPIGTPTWKTTAGTVFSWRVMRVIVLLTIVLLIMGLLIWLAERRANAEQFGGTVPEGIGAGFWWAAVTMTTVGYGDKAAKTFVGRLLSLIWMFTALFLIGIFIANMTSALTVGQLGGPIRGLEDLPNASVATLEGSTSEAWLRENRIPTFRYFSDLGTALQSVAGGSIDAVFYDKPLLEYWVNQEMSAEIELLRETFGHQDYAIALPEGSALREPVNRALLSPQIQGEWRDILFRYLKEAPAPPPRPDR